MGSTRAFLMNREDKTLEEISDANLINHFKTELEMIGKGEKAGDVLPDGVMSKFRKMGLFKRKQSSELSAKALKILQEIHEE